MEILLLQVLLKCLEEVIMIPSVLLLEVCLVTFYLFCTSRTHNCSLTVLLSVYYFHLCTVVCVLAAQ